MVLKIREIRPKRWWEVFVKKVSFEYEVEQRRSDA